MALVPVVQVTRTVVIDNGRSDHRLSIIGLFHLVHAYYTVKIRAHPFAITLSEVLIEGQVGKGLNDCRASLIFLVVVSDKEMILVNFDGIISHVQLA